MLVPELGGLRLENGAGQTPRVPHTVFLTLPPPRSSDAALLPQWKVGQVLAREGLLEPQTGGVPGSDSLWCSRGVWSPPCQCGQVARPGDREG